MSQTRSYPFRTLCWLVLPLLLCMWGMQYFAPPGEKARAPYNSVVVALEFAYSGDAIADTLDPLSSEEILGLDRLNYVDLAFMLVYSLFLALFIWRLGMLREQRFKSMLWLAVVVLFADLLENLMMFRITSLYMEGAADFSPYSNFLPFFTWIKWGMLAVTFGFIAFQLIRGGLFSQLVAISLFVPLILLAFVVVQHDGWINRFVTSIFLAFGTLIVFSLLYKK